MIPPLVSFVTWNRMGLTIRNLNALLDNDEEFELHIADNNSRDETWLYIQSLNDKRIKSKVRFDTNRGQVYAVNYNLSKRRKEQYFITVDSDVNLHTKDWVTRFIKAFEEFPEVGLLGAVSSNYYYRYKHPLIKHEKNSMSYFQLCRGFVEGCCQCLRPEVLNHLGYWSEENCMGDVEICYRICNCTFYNAGFFPGIEIDQKQSIQCEQCDARNWCKIAFKEKNCFKLWSEKYGNPGFKDLYGWKYEKWIDEFKKGIRSAFCASIHDEASRKRHYYNIQMAEENFQYYIKNSNQ